MADQLRRQDRDRFVTTLLAPASRRQALIALYVVNLELARIQDLVHEPMLGEIRLQWWQDGLAALTAGRTTQSASHPALAVLAAPLSEQHLALPLFEGLVEARQDELRAIAPADAAEMTARADRTGGTLAELALELLGAATPSARQAARHVGTAWSLTGLLRSVPADARAGRVLLPDELLALHGVGRDALVSGRPSEGLADLARQTVGMIGNHLMEARRLAREVPRAGTAALLPAVLAEHYLVRLKRTGFNLFDAAWAKPQPPVAGLLLAWLRGHW